MRGQGTLVLGAILFVVLLFVLLGVYIKLMNSVTSIGSALREMQLRESLRSREAISVDIEEASMVSPRGIGTRIDVLLRITNLGSITTRIEYVVLACYTGSGRVKAIASESMCRMALAPGESRRCHIVYSFDTGCKYVTITLVTALGNSYTVRVG